MSRSLKVPGSPSSELHTMYFWPVKPFGMKDHLSPVGNPAPPRPRSADFFTSATTASGAIFSSTILASALEPPVRAVEALHDDGVGTVIEHRHFNSSTSASIFCGVMKLSMRLLSTSI